jgi:hypothetical protein
MSLPKKGRKSTAAENAPPRESRDLALLELERRRLERELTKVLLQYQQLSEEISNSVVDKVWSPPRINIGP